MKKIKTVEEIIIDLPDNELFTGRPDFFMCSPEFKALVETWFPSKKARRKGEKNEIH